MKIKNKEGGEFDIPLNVIRNKISIEAIMNLLIEKGVIKKEEVENFHKKSIEQFNKGYPGFLVENEKPTTPKEKDPTPL